MRQLKLSKVGQSINNEDLRIIEEELGIAIPNLYKSFLLQENGGYMPKLAKDSKYDIRDFLSVNKNADDSLQSLFQVVSQIFNNTKDWLPFGFDAGDWIYCICLKEDRYGQVYLMRTDETEEDEAFIFICNSLEEFIDGLQPEEPQG